MLEPERSKAGLLFDLPGTVSRDGAATDLVALVLPHGHETLAFFDDSRYILGDESSFKALGESFAARVEKSPSKTLLVLADRRIPAGDLMKLAEAARRSGISKVLFAGKSEETAELGSASAANLPRRPRRWRPPVRETCYPA